MAKQTILSHPPSPFPGRQEDIDVGLSVTVSLFWAFDAQAKMKTFKVFSKWKLLISLLSTCSLCSMFSVFLHTSFSCSNCNRKDSCPLKMAFKLLCNAPCQYQCRNGKSPKEILLPLQIEEKMSQLHKPQASLQLHCLSKDFVLQKWIAEEMSASV